MRIVSAFKSIYVPRDGGVGSHLKRVEIPKAVFHKFGVDFEQFETGAGPFSTAIIELPDGSIENVPVENITFTNPAIKAN